MKIRVENFEPQEGVVFALVAENETERVLLFACVADDNNLTGGVEETEFLLTLPVSN